MADAYRPFRAAIAIGVFVLIGLLGLPIGLLGARLFVPGWRPVLPCKTVDETKADFDGDGTVDRIESLGDNDWDEHNPLRVHITTTRGATSDLEHGGDGGGYGLYDLNHDGRTEIALGTGTAAWAAFAEFWAPTEQGRLNYGAAFTTGITGGSWDKHPGDSLEQWDWTCADIDGDGFDELIQGYALRTRHTGWRWASYVYEIGGVDLRVSCVRRGQLKTDRIDTQKAWPSPLGQAFATACDDEIGTEARSLGRGLASEWWTVEAYRSTTGEPLDGTADRAWALGSWWGITDQCRDVGRDCAGAVELVRSVFGIDPRRVSACDADARGLRVRDLREETSDRHFQDFVYDGYVSSWNHVAKEHRYNFHDADRLMAAHAGC